jgi:sec-independent protein translocase protein TatC
MEEKTILEHIKDLKIIVIRLIIYATLLFALSLFFVDKIFTEITALVNIKNVKLVYSSVYSGFSSHILVSLNTALIVFLPFFTLEVLIYLKNSFKIPFFTFFISLILYFLGVFSTLYIIIPFFTNFLLSISFFGVDFYIEAEKLISFIMQTLLAFAFIFQIPIVINILLKAGVISKKFLKRQRKKVFVLSFVLGAILTPPDVLSQIVGAFIIYCFFEASILLAKENTACK